MRRATVRSGRAAALGLEDTQGPIKRFLKRNMIGAAGLSLIALCAALAAALATWSTADPSFSHATSAPVRNALGTPGAVIADVFIQSIGLASAVFLVPVVLWGWRLLAARRRALRPGASVSGWRARCWPPVRLPPCPCPRAGRCPPDLAVFSAISCICYPEP